MKTRIATVGSCVTRDNFNSIFNPNYKMFFDLVLHQHQVSIPSLMSKKVVYEEDETTEKLPDFGRWHLRTECNKEFLSSIQKKNPEYLLMDLDGDVHFGVSEISDGNYFTNNPKFTNISFLNKYSNKMLLKDDPDAYFKIWQPKIDEFFSFLRTEVPNCKIILVKARFSDRFADGSSLTELRKKKNLKILDVDYMNSLWDRLDNYIINKYDVRIIDMTQKNYYLDPKHAWGAFYLHYKKDFYSDFLSKLQLLIDSDMREELVKLKDLTNEMQVEINSLRHENSDLRFKLNSYENESLLKLIKRKTLKTS